MRKYIVAAACFIAAAVASVTANTARADDWPVRPVKMIVGFAPAARPICSPG